MARHPLLARRRTALQDLEAVAASVYELVDVFEDLGEPFSVRPSDDRIAGGAIAPALGRLLALERYENATANELDRRECWIVTGARAGVWTGEMIAFEDRQERRGFSSRHAPFPDHATVRAPRC
jgi:hypothetical protein